MRVYIATWRWSGIPFYLRAGKRLSTSMTEVAVFFQHVPAHIFPVTAGECKPNVLIFRVQPLAGVTMQLNTKQPGMQLKLTQTGMDFSSQESFGEDQPCAYERLLLDALTGDSSLFLQNDEIEAAWRFIDPIREGWRINDKPHLTFYSAGSDGPVAADELILSDGRSWRPLCVHC